MDCPSCKHTLTKDLMDNNRMTCVCVWCGKEFTREELTMKIEKTATGRVK